MKTIMIIKPEEIKSRLQVRTLKPLGVETLKDNINKDGYDEEERILVRRLPDDGYRLIDGNHRLEAILLLGLNEIPATVIEDDITEEEEIYLARLRNDNTETCIRTTFHDDYKFISDERIKGKSLDAISKEMRWGLSKVKNYSSLSSIGPEVWDAIRNYENKPDEEKSHTCDFSEGLLRSILQLPDDNQILLITALINGEITKAEFKAKALICKIHNEMKHYAETKLSLMTKEKEKYMGKVYFEIEQCYFDDEWKKKNSSILLDNVLSSMLNGYQDNNNTCILEGNFFSRIKEIPDNHIDLIITTPIYKTREDREFSFTQVDDILENEPEFEKKYSRYANELYRVLKPGGSGYIFTKKHIFNIIPKLKEAGFLTYRWRWVKDFTQLDMEKKKELIEYTKINKEFIHIYEEIVCIEKGDPCVFNSDVLKDNKYNRKFITPETPEDIRIKFYSDVYTDKFAEDEYSDVFNGSFIVPPVKEDQLLDEDFKSQIPESILEKLIQLSSLYGDTVFDGCMGVGEVGLAARKLDRKFIGIEEDQSLLRTAKIFLSV